MAHKSLKALRQAQGLHPERSRSLKKGIFITLEGPEGCGKSTQSKLLREYLIKRGYACVHTREPGGTAVGDHIRHILLHSKDINISDLTELFLFEANRSQIAEEVIRPSLAKKRVVICDRFSDATIAYQGYGGRMPLETIKALDAIATAGLKPDLTILLDIGTKLGLARASAKGTDRMEDKDVAYHKRVRRGYMKLARREPRRIKVIRVTDGIDKIQKVVRREAEGVIQKYKRAG